MGASSKSSLMANYFTYELPLKTRGQRRPAATKQRNDLSGPAMFYSFASFILPFFFSSLGSLCRSLPSMFSVLRLKHILSVFVIFLFLILSDR